VTESRQLIGTGLAVEIDAGDERPQRPRHSFHFPGRGPHGTSLSHDMALDCAGS
jgi:hypothetical protein